MFSTPTKAFGSGWYASPRPSSPPVRWWGFFATSTEPACANARVTMAKAIPPTRRTTGPRTSGSRSPTPAVKSTADANDQFHFVIAMSQT